MAFDATTMHALARELNDNLAGGRIDKVTQGEKYQITLYLRANQKNHKLLISASSAYARIHLTEHATMNPESPPMFCMLLRKRLIGSRIVSVEQIGMERIIKINLLAHDELSKECEYHLYCEVMGRHSNIILVDQNNKIIEPIKRVDEDISRVRQLLPGLEYSLPPSQNKLDPKTMSRDDFYKLLLLNKEENVVKALQDNVLGISKNTIIYLTQNFIDIDSPLSRLTDKDIDNLSKDIYDFYSLLFSNKLDFYAVLDDDGSIKDFTLSANELSGYSKKYSSINELLDDFYSYRALHDNIARRVSALRQSVKTQLDRSVRKLEIQYSILEDEKSLDTYKLYGELITAYSYMVKKGMDEVELDNYYSLSGEKITVPLDSKRNASGNAAQYFKKYKKLKTAIELAHGQIEKLSIEVNYLENILHLIDTCDSEDLAIEIQNELMEGGYIKKANKKTSRKLPPSKPHHFLSSDNHDIYVGRNNKQNDELTMRFAKNDDIWLHTKDIPGSHVIVRQKNNTVSQKAINEGAFLAAWYSKARNSSNIPVDFTQRKNIRKPNGAKPGYVIYLQNSTINVTCSKEEFAKFNKIESE